MLTNSKYNKTTQDIQQISIQEEGNTIEMADWHRSLQIFAYGTDRCKCVRLPDLIIAIFE